MKFKATVEFEYEVNDDGYTKGTTKQQMIEMERITLETDFEMLTYWLEVNEESYKVKIKEV